MTVFMLVLTFLFMNGATLGIRSTVRAIGYEDRLFDTSTVHTVAIVMNDWDDMIENAANEEYYTATVVIDGESYKNVGIRTKGNTSLSTVANLGSERYSFKIEFDHYDDTKSYHGLDKLCLNNLIQDSTMMKDYLTYTLMNRFGVKSPLCSYAYITVNGEEWGLYLAVEGVEEAFLERNYGSDYGNLYKPESTQSGGNRGGMNSSAVKLQYIDDTVESYADIWDNDKTDIDKSDQTRLIESLRNLLYNDEIESVVDLEQIIRYFVVHNYVCNGDSYTGSMVHNYYLYEKNGKLSMIPWDYNLAFGTFGSGNANTVVNAPSDKPIENASDDDRPLWNVIAANEEYTERYHRYFSEFLRDINVSEIIDSAYEQTENSNEDNALPANMPSHNDIVEEQPIDFHDNRQVPPDNRFDENRVQDFHERERNTDASPGRINIADSSGIVAMVLYRCVGGCTCRGNFCRKKIPCLPPSQLANRNTINNQTARPKSRRLKYLYRYGMYRTYTR